MTRRKPFLIYFLAFVSAVFIGILVFAYFATKRANPKMLQVGQAPGMASIRTAA